MPRNERSSSRSGQCKPKGESSMWLSWIGVPSASRGFSATGKRSSTPLSIETMMNPSWKRAVRAVSVKVFMPLLDDKPLVSTRKLFGVGQFADLQADGFSKFNRRIDVEHRFTGTVADVNVDEAMLVAVKEETTPVLLKNLRHVGMIADPSRKASVLGLTDLERASVGSAAWPVNSVILSGVFPSFPSCTWERNCPGRWTAQPKSKRSSTSHAIAFPSTTWEQGTKTFAKESLFA